MARSEQAGDKGNLILLDDSPAYMDHYGIMDKPSVLISGGGPGYAVPKWRIDEGAPYVPSKNDDWVMPVGMKDNSGNGGTRDVEGGEQAPAETPGGDSQSGGSGSPSGGQQSEQPYNPDDPTTWPAPTLEAWKATPWGQGIKFGPQDPHAFNYPTAGEPPDTPEGRRIRALIENYAKQYNVPAQLMLNTAYKESGGTWNPNLTSKAGAQGLFQLMPETAKSLGVGNPFDVEQSIKGATEYMAKLLRITNGDPVRAAIGYNGGTAPMMGRKPLAKETRYHIAKIFGLHAGDLPPNVAVPIEYPQNPNAFYGKLYEE